MAQVKIYGLREALKPIQQRFSDSLHSCLADALKLPADKKFQRYLFMDQEDYLYPGDRSPMYTIIEIHMFEGRSVEVKKRLIALIFERMANIGFEAQDIEITIIETPKSNWGIRGIPGDELPLSYKVDV